MVPYASFSFAKLWILAAEVELRLKHLGAARKLLGNALGRHPKDKLFRYYVALELRLGEVDRVRKLYERWL